MSGPSEQGEMDPLWDVRRAARLDSGAVPVGGVDRQRAERKRPHWAWADSRLRGAASSPRWREDGAGFSLRCSIDGLLYAIP